MTEMPIQETIMKSEQTQNDDRLEQKLEESKLILQKEMEENLILKEKMEQMEKERDVLQSTHERRVNEKLGQIGILNETIEKMQTQLIRLKEQNEELKVNRAKLQKREKMFEDMYDEELKKGLELKENQRKLEEELLQKNEWKNSISIIENVETSKVDENMNEMLTAIEKDLETQTKKFKELEEKMKQKDQEIKKLKDKVTKAERLVKEKDRIITLIESNNKKAEGDGEDTDQSSERQMVRILRFEDLLDLTGKFMDGLEPKVQVRAKNIISGFVEQRVSVFN